MLSIYFISVYLFSDWIFAGITSFSCFMCLSDKNILIYYCNIYSFIRTFHGTYADYYWTMARQNISFQWQVLCIMQIKCAFVANINSLHNSRDSTTLLSVFLLHLRYIELTLGPNSKSNYWFNFFICQKNYHSLTACNFKSLKSFRNSKRSRCNLSIRIFSSFLSFNRKQ